MIRLVVSDIPLFIRVVSDVLKCVNRDSADRAVQFRVGEGVYLESQWRGRGRVSLLLPVDRVEGRGTYLVYYEELRGLNGQLQVCKGRILTITLEESRVTYTVPGLGTNSIPTYPGDIIRCGEYEPEPIIFTSRMSRGLSYLVAKGPTLLEIEPGSCSLTRRVTSNMTQQVRWTEDTLIKWSGTFTSIQLDWLGKLGTMTVSSIRYPRGLVFWDEERGVVSLDAVGGGVSSLGFTEVPNHPLVYQVEVDGGQLLDAVRWHSHGYQPGDTLSLCLGSQIEIRSGRNEPAVLDGGTGDTVQDIPLAPEDLSMGIRAGQVTIQLYKCYATRINVLLLSQEIEGIELRNLVVERLRR